MIDARLARLREKLAEQQFDALFVSDPFNRRYLSGFTGSAGHLLITAGEAVIATDFRYWEQAGVQCPRFRLYQTVGTMADWLPGLIFGLGGQRLGFEAASLSYADYQQIVKIIDAMPAAERPRFVSSESLVEALRALKDAGEIAALERVVALGDAAFNHAAAQLKAGGTELQTARAIENYIKDHGGEGTSFTPIVAGGARGAMPHARAGQDLLREGEGVVIDMGALLDGYCSDMTRTLFLGTPDARFSAIYDIVFTAQQTAAELIEPGMSGELAHKIAHKVIAEAGYGENFGHGLGHGIGLQVHEEPWLKATSKSVLQEGMVFSIEPGIYLSGWGGVRIEDLFVLENGRCRVLSNAPKLHVSDLTSVTGVSG
ncbi:MAG TPA: Xaa-Pro peptidase family protein [Dehalococcoidia bacterium]|nr:Xaa-Pro peptidase family protein [Dehalococcoidia bacterium]